MSAPLLKIPDLNCTRCRKPTRLAARIGEELFCAACWHKAGRPYPPPPTRAQAHDAEVKTREHMLARGGADRHRVRAGRS